MRKQDDLRYEERGIMKMKRNIKVEFVSREPVEEQKIEIVERKGLGHPDSLCNFIE